MKQEQGLDNQKPAVNKFNNYTRAAVRLLTLNPLFLLGAAVVAAGVITGLFLSNVTGGYDALGKIEVAPGAKVTNKEIGIEDTKTFRDEIEGLLEEGGIEGEGSHHLTREGGPSQNVYLTSSVINLDDFIGKKVHVWGETNKGQKAGWFMDVGKIKIID